MILAQLRTAVLAAFPGLDAPKKAFFRVVRDVAGCFNLQAVNATLDQTKDLSTIEVCPGVPGVTSDPTEGEQVVVMFVGKDEVPYVIARASASMPGHISKRVYHDAARAIHFISKTSSSAAKMHVGASPTFPLALASDATAIVTKMQALGASLSLNPSPDVAAVGAAITAAFLGFAVVGTTKLEAK